jgi:hypothetical protein
MLFIYLVLFCFVSVIFNFLEKLCITKLKMCPACRDPKVSDGELVSLSLRKPPFYSGLLNVGCAGAKKSGKRKDFVKQYSVFRIKEEALETEIFSRCSNFQILTVNSLKNLNTR